MMDYPWTKLLSLLFALVWLINGLFCKVLHLVPRHEQIVAHIFNHQVAPSLTVIIGVLETMMAFWILSKWKPKTNAVVQMVLVAAMNLCEIILVPDLLLFGPFNIIIAGIFIFVVWYHAFRSEERRVGKECRYG